MNPFVSVWLALSGGLALSVVIEQLLRPRSPLHRPWAAWCLHMGIWAVAYGLLILLLGRPLFAALAVSALMLVLVLVSNAKFRSLRAPFIFQDYDFFTDLIRHPRLYLPFLGWGKFIAAAFGVALAVATGLWIEEMPAERWAWSGQLGASAAVLGMGGLCLALGVRHAPAIRLQPEADLRSMGFLASLWCYAAAAHQPVQVASPYTNLSPSPVLSGANDRHVLPDLVAVQSESFFDPRPLIPGIRTEVLAEFDRLCAQALVHGKLSVPAWGAYTVRTEFGFLTGMAEESLGAQRFNPYRAVARGWQVASLASWLKRLGYHTVCIHPYPASFYQRDRVLARLGFDDFLDLRAFDGAAHFGPFVGDAAVAERIVATLQSADRPVFVMAITMENHGPLHLEKLAPGDARALHATPLPPDCEDVTVYLRHLCNADRMVARLRLALQASDRPISMCWYGDHVPILPEAYRVFGEPSGAVPYAIWGNRGPYAGRVEDLAVEDLSMHWLRMLGLAAPAKAACLPANFP